MDLRVWGLSVLTGVVVGFLFSAIKLPLPAPPVFSGVLGIIGIWAGGVLYNWMSRLWQ
ncbi:DUF1427 family protein [Effusibacillus dendaii]|uniref:XapX domain protein n=1 Tax=Effusibacillus dendaii TaxID=2743772 RepID=A0A7I8DC15_9BACL|nr:DUF1427 family protein [Effusibacillus dendaii]BCJ87634.1 XapX domain protein [Effusibacillus dendaii]